MTSSMPPRRSGEAMQEELNPHRREEQRRAGDHTRDMLIQRGIRVEPSDDVEGLAFIEESVELFEAMVRARGGDSYLDSPRSSRPERPDWVVPERGAGQSARDYADRIRDAAERLRRAP